MKKQCAGYQLDVPESFPASPFAGPPIDQKERSEAMWEHCVIDAAMGCRSGLFTFCPIEGDIEGEFKVVTGMNYVSTVPPDGMKVVAIIHPNGQAAVGRFCAEHEAALSKLQEAMRGN